MNSACQGSAVVPGPRGPIPQVGESAAVARGRGCVVNPLVLDDAVVEAVRDEYPGAHRWTIWWSTGMRDGMRQPGDPPSPVEPPCRPVLPLGRHCGVHGRPLYPSGVCQVTLDAEQADGVRSAIAAWLRSPAAAAVVTETFRANKKGERAEAIGEALAQAILDRRDLPLEEG